MIYRGMLGIFDRGDKPTRSSWLRCELRRGGDREADLQLPPSLTSLRVLPLRHHSHPHSLSLSLPLLSPPLILPHRLPTPLPPPSLNWESGRAVEIALTRALPGCAIHLLFYYAAPGLPGRCRSICHRPRSLITGICHRLASLLMLSSPP